MLTCEGKKREAVQRQLGNSECEWAPLHEGHGEQQHAPRQHADVLVRRLLPVQQHGELVYPSDPRPKV